MYVYIYIYISHQQGLPRNPGVDGSAYGEPEQGVQVAPGQPERAAHMRARRKARRPPLLGHYGRHTRWVWSVLIVCVAQCCSVFELTMDDTPAGYGVMSCESSHACIYIRVC